MAIYYKGNRLDGNSGGGLGNSTTFEWFSPKMTSNTTPAPYVASASAEPYAWNAAWMAFDGIIGVDGNMWHSPNVKSWIQFDFGKEILIKGIRMYAHANTSSFEYTKCLPKVFSILGSKDGNTYTNLFTSNDGSMYTPGVDLFSECMFSDNSIKYRYYKIDCDLNYIGNYYTVIADIQFYLSMDKATSESSEDVYSTEETRIGTWIDGRPVFRKVTEFKIIPESEGVAQGIDHVTTANTEKIISCQLLVYLDQGETVEQWPWGSYRDIHHVFSHDVDNSYQLRMYYESTTVQAKVAGCGATLIVEYVKYPESNTGN